jgi:N,N'-diacetyllegionaminate synthase
MVAIEIDGKKIGPSEKTYFIAEAGLNHNGDIQIAKKLIENAKNAGADAIKFQTYKTEEFLSNSSEYFKFFKNVELTYDDFKELNDFSKKIGITFFSAPFDIESANFLDKIDVPCFKIASGEITNIPLLKHIAKMGKPMIISTGLCNMKEVEDAVNTCIEEGNSQLALFHCVANYPTQPEEVNLTAMETMREKFNIPIGFSDNGESTLVDLAAVSLGANLIEKHYTLKKDMEGPDHFFSIEPSRMKKLIEEIRVIEKMRGNGKKMPQPSEVSNRPAIRKSIMASKLIQKNTILSKEVLSIKRPGDGIEPKYLGEILGKKVNKEILQDESLKWENIEK